VREVGGGGLVQGWGGAWTSSPVCEQAVRGGIADMRVVAVTDGWVRGGGRLMLKQKLGRPGVG
jgi:hypothetical protein